MEAQVTWLTYIRLAVLCVSKQTWREQTRVKTQQVFMSLLWYLLTLFIQLEVVHRAMYNR